MNIIKGKLLINVLSLKRTKTSFYLFSSVSAFASIRKDTMTTSHVIKRFDNIIKSQEDKRSYRGIELKNRMKVLLVSDPLTDKSAAALDVNIGYLSDPDNLPGLAHFCEHMLFMGTEKYPDENNYSKFLNENGGTSNAATYLDHTNYYFDVVPDQLREALDRFAQFFLTPLFTESATERELNAVNSEHEKNLSSDGWRFDQLDKHLSNHKYDYHKFGSGNKHTLEVVPKQNGINVRDELLNFHQTFYSSNIMSLAVLGKESLDELEALIVELFSEVQDKDVEAPIWNEHPFDEEQLGTCTYIIPIKEMRNLNILFPCPDIHEHFKSAPDSYISHLIGHEGPGSILALLKEKGWSNSLLAGYKSPNRGTAFFGISMDLTDEGLKHTDDIIKLTFQYLNMLKTIGPLEDYHEENKKVDAMMFRFKDKESPRAYISLLAHQLQEYPMEHVLSSHRLLTEWEPNVIMDLLNQFVPDKIRVGIISKKFEEEADSVEPWYGTKYKTFKLAKETLDEWETVGLCDQLRMPDKNDFIPTNFDLYPLDKEMTDQPIIIKDTNITRLWFKQDDKYLLPKTNLLFDFVSPLAYLDPLNCNLTHMFTQLFRDALNQYAYAAELAGLKWELSNTKYGLILSVGGFSNKQDIFLEKIMEKLTNFEVDPKRFEIYKENYIRMLKNFFVEQPYQHAVYYLAVLLTEHSWTKQELLEAVNEVTIDKLEAFIPQILSKMHIECMVHGNANKQKALDLVEIVEKCLNQSYTMIPLLPRQLLLNRELRLEDGCNYVYQVENSIHKSSCVEIYYQCGMQSKESNVMLELISQIIQEPCFNILRTKEQLGYIVFSGLRRSSGVQGLRIIIQSDKHPSYVDTRIENFLRTMKTHIADMSDEDFKKHKESLASRRLEKPKQLSAQSYLFWSEITSQQYHFDRVNVEVAHLQTLTKEDVLHFFNAMLDENAAQRHKIGVYVISTAEGGAGLIEANDIEAHTAISDVTVFKSAHGMHPLVQPYINITRKGNKCKL